MPSREDGIVDVISTMPESNNSTANNNNGSGNNNKDFLTPQVEELVAAIKHNLRLKSRSCSSMCSNSKRMSPYDIRNRTGKQTDQQFCSSGACGSNQGKQRVTSIVENPYEMLQELLREGSLIKEAVKRLEQPPKKTKEVNYYEYDCSFCDLPTTDDIRTIEL